MKIGLHFLDSQDKKIARLWSGAGMRCYAARETPILMKDSSP